MSKNGDNECVHKNIKLKNCKYSSGNIQESYYDIYEKSHFSCKVMWKSTEPHSLKYLYVGKT